MDCCSSPYSEFGNRHSIGGLNGPSQEASSSYYNYSSSVNGGLRYPIPQSTIPPVYRGGGAIPPLPSPALTQPPSNGIDSPVYNENPNNDRYSTYPHHAPHSFGGSLQTGGYFNGYNREHNSNYNYYHPYDGYNRYSYHHKDTYSSNYNTYSSPYYQRDHNHHHQQPPPSPHPHYHNPYMYNSRGHHMPQTPSYLTDTDGNQTSSSSNSNTPGSLYSEYSHSPGPPYTPSAPSIIPGGGTTLNATGFPYTNKDGKIRKSTSRDKEKSKVGNRKTSNSNNNNSSIDSSGLVDPIDRCGTPFHGPTQPMPYPNDPYTNFPFGMMNRMNQPHQNSYMATQSLPSNFLGNQVPWSTGLNRNKKGTIVNGCVSDDQMPPPPSSGSTPRTTTPSSGGKTETKTVLPASSEKSDIPKTQTAAGATKTSRPVKRTRKKAKPIPITNNSSNNTKMNTANSKIEPTQKEQQILSEINKNLTPLPGFQQAFGSTEIGRFSEVFFNLSESPIIEQLLVESEADTLSPQPWENGDSLEGPHFNLQIGAYYADNYYNNNNTNSNTNSGSSNNTNSSDLYSNPSSCINIHNNNYNYYQYDSGGSSCSTNSNNYSLYNSNNSNNNFLGNNNINNNCYFREISCSDY